MEAENTNFEKWKRKMTVESMLDIFKNVGCYKCPAIKVCKVTEGCENAFIKWARQEEGKK